MDTFLNVLLWACWVMMGALGLAFPVLLVLAFRAESETNRVLIQLKQDQYETERLIRENRAAAWRELASLERRGILTPTVKYRTLEWLTSDE